MQTSALPHPDQGMLRARASRLRPPSLATLVAALVAALVTLGVQVPPVARGVVVSVVPLVLATPVVLLTAKGSDLALFPLWAEIEA